MGEVATHDFAHGLLGLEVDLRRVVGALAVVDGAGEVPTREVKAGPDMLLGRVAGGRFVGGEPRVADAGDA